MLATCASSTVKLLAFTQHRLFKNMLYSTDLINYLSITGYLVSHS